MLAYLEFHPQSRSVPLLILHGLFGSARNWQTIGKRLSLTYSVYCLDLRNHGASEWRSAMTYPDMAADVAEAIVSLDLGAVHLIGHSMGGKAAMALALTAPSLLHSLMVVDIAPVSYSHDFRTYLRALRSIPLETLASRQQADALLAPAIEEPFLRGFLLQNLERDVNGWRWRCNLAALEACLSDLTDFPDFHAAYHGPALFVRGAMSDYIRSEHASRILELFPEARHKTIPSAGHWIHAQQPDAFLATVTDFCR